MAAAVDTIEPTDANVPDRSGYAPTWYSATMVPAAAYAPLAGNLDVDVCVIGGGLAGLTAAREIARSGWSVVVLEADRVGGKASGCNCGFVLPGFALAADQIVERVGPDAARDLWALSQSGLEYVRSTILETGMPGRGSGRRVARSFEDRRCRAGHRHRAAARSGPRRGGRGLGHGPGPAMLKSSHYFNAIYYPRAFHIHPLNYAIGLAAAAAQAGAHIFEHTPATAIDPDGVRKRVETPGGRIRAAHVVVAGNVHIGALMPRLAGTLLPIWTYLAVTAPLGPRLADAIIYHGAVSDGARADNHYRVVDGDRLLISGRATLWQADPRSFAGALAGDIARLYPQLGEVRFEHSWSGVLGRTLHGMPQIGELSQGLWLASGFGGHGFNTTAMAGNLISRAIVHGDDAWRQFLPFELIWAGGRLGRVVAQAGYWWSRAQAERKARAAREREASGRQPAAIEEPHVALHDPVTNDAP